MIKNNNLRLQEESDFKRVSEMFFRNYRLVFSSVIIAISLAFLVNRLSIPVYKISSSILIRENNLQQNRNEVNDYLNSSLFGKNQNFQNELWVIKSTPVIEQTIKNLDLSVTYYDKQGFKYADAYKNIPFQIAFMSSHPQPVEVMFKLTFLNEDTFLLEAKSKKVSFYNFETEKTIYKKDKWEFRRAAKFGELIENGDLAIIIKPDTNNTAPVINSPYGFEFKTLAMLSNDIKKNIEFTVVDRLATVIEISLKSESLDKGTEIINELMNVYSDQNLKRKNHIASITIDYIEKQLDEISDSLSLTEDNLQRFRSSNQLLNVSEQANGISAQYLSLQNQLAELVSRKRYYDYVSEYLLKNENFSNMIVPASLGIDDPLLNSLMAELIAAQAQRSNLIVNNQERNPLVAKLGIQIDNVKKTISDNIDAVAKTTAISIDEMNKRISKIEAEISRLPATQRQLGNIERKYNLNDAIYSYMLEKRAEAKITKASNLPDETVIEPAKMVGLYPVSPNKRLNYVIAFFLGLVMPFGFLTAKKALNNKIVDQDSIEQIANEPVLGKILHNSHKARNVMFEYPKSNIAESFRVLRTNIDFYIRGGQKKVIMVSSCLEKEGKTFISLNLAMSYAQLGRRTILVDFDLRKSKNYFDDPSIINEGLSSYLINKISLESIIKKSPHNKLDYIQAGLLPPNPVELIAMDKTNKLLSRLKEEYDIIVLDTTPLAQVTDAYLLMEHTDLKLIVARQNQTLKKVFTTVIKDLKIKKVNNVCIVLNDNRVTQDQYGYGYGYNNATKNGKQSQKIADVTIPVNVS